MARSALAGNRPDVYLHLQGDQVAVDKIARGYAPVAATPAAPPPSSTPAVATADGETPGIKAEIQELKRNSGGAVTLKLTLINRASKDLGFGYDFGDSDHHIKDFASVGGISLIDAVNKKKYLVARGSEDTCLCSRGLNSVGAGERLNVWAKFPAPPDDVQKINVAIPHFFTCR